MPYIEIEKRVKNKSLLLKKQLLIEKKMFNKSPDYKVKIMIYLKIVTLKNEHPNKYLL